MSRVLVVEDHQRLLRSLRRGLELLGYEILTADTGEEGYSLALSSDVDIVVLDVMLPGKNGFEILRDLRTTNFRKPVLILTAKDSLADRQRGRECGADDFLAKPFAFTDLVTSLQRLLQPGGAGRPAMEEP